MYSIFTLLPFLNTGIIPSVVALLMYVGVSVGIFSLARKCGLKGAALAWIPFLRYSLLGRLADEYLAKSKGKSTKYRIVLPILVGISLIAYQLAYLAYQTVLILYVVSVFFVCILVMLGAAAQLAFLVPLAYLLFMVVAVLFVSLATALSAVTSVTALVYHGIRVWVLHPVYKMCDKENATLYTVLSILFNFAPALALPYAAAKLEPDTEEAFDAYLADETIEA